MDNKLEFVSEKEFSDILSNLLGLLDGEILKHNPIKKNSIDGVTSALEVSDLKKTDYGYKVILRTEGLSENDIKVSVIKNEIIVAGKTTFEDVTYESNYKIPLGLREKGEIVNVKYKVINGITHIYIYTRKPQEHVITVEKI